MLTHTTDTDKSRDRTGDWVGLDENYGARNFASSILGRIHDKNLPMANFLLYLL
jgi:hypothetical protein